VLAICCKMVTFYRLLPCPSSDLSLEMIILACQGGSCNSRLAWYYLQCRRSAPALRQRCYAFVLYSMMAQGQKTFRQPRPHWDVVSFDLETFPQR
jgi:hypothetical protein